VKKKLPRASVTAGEFSGVAGGIVVLSQTAIDIVCLPDVSLASPLVPQDINEVHGHLGAAHILISATAEYYGLFGPESRFSEAYQMQAIDRDSTAQVPATTFAAILSYGDRLSTIASS
jgi:hypothetical protein